MTEWIGLSISLYIIDAPDDVYQGVIEAATSKCLTLTNVFCNGLPVPDKQVIFSSESILNIEIINNARAQLEKSLSHKKQQSCLMTSVKTSTPNTSSRHGQFHNYKDKQCFQDSILNEACIPDFDFEKNLALFDKKKFVMTKNGTESRHEKNDVSWLNAIRKKRPLASGEQAFVSTFEKNSYKWYENVLDPIRSGSPRMVQLLELDGVDAKPGINTRDQLVSYETSSGFKIPSITAELLQHIYRLLDKKGFSRSRANELFAKSCTEMILQLLGGDRRIHPKNRHQTPIVVFICSDSSVGQVGYMIARQLASHDMCTIVHESIGQSASASASTSTSRKSKETEIETNLYKLTLNRIEPDLKQIPENVDLIVIAVHQSDALKSYVIEWIRNKSASVLAIDPPTTGFPNVNLKLSLLPILPLAHSERNGPLYLCNLMIPVKVFTEVGIKYRSPFTSKSVIALYKSCKTEANLNTTA